MKDKSKLTLLAAFLVMVAVAHADDMREAPRLEPKGTTSLEYPNEWDINKLIALSNDGSRLIDATEDARYIRVWDWENKKVVQRLLLNEKAPEENDGKPHHEMVLQSALGQELALSSDGRMVAACVRIQRKTASSSSTSIVRVWNLEDGAIVEDNIASPLRHVPGLDQEAILLLGCQSISFSQDGRYMAVLVDASKYANEVDFDERSANFNPQTGKYKEGKNPARLTGIALFETHDWKLERFFSRPQPQQLINSRPLFDPDSKTVSAVVFDRPPVTPNAGRAWSDKWVGNRIVRWDIASGAQLEERDMPQLASSPDNGLWWIALSGGREVWWRTNYTLYPLVQTEAEAQQCKQYPATVPAFISEMASNCAYDWMLTVLNLDTGKLNYLAPIKKKVLSQLRDELKQYYSAAISFDGAYIILDHIKFNQKNRLGTSTVEILDKKTLQQESTYFIDKDILSEAAFSAGSRYFAFKADKSAVVLELPQKK